MDYKEKYRLAHWNHTEKHFPEFAKASNGSFKKPLPKVHTANGLATFIINYCHWHGFLNVFRNNTTGRYRPGKVLKSVNHSGGVYQEKGTWLKSEKGKGHADITGSIRGVSVSFEIKIGEDKPSESQLKMQKIVSEDGGVYEFIKHPDDFLAIFETLLQN